MRDGVSLLESNDKVLLAFQLMNRAMLLQQLHYNLPLQTWGVDETDSLFLENPVEKLPDINDPETWYQKDKKVYGKWRPFQLAFVLINLRSMCENDCDDRQIVDLIWFPTGGGKTEAYLGLSAYTIFIRRLLDKTNAGTAILMRYTLRLLTSQQYERASAMICACDIIRKENEALLGTDRISIGLWVGGDTSPNSMQEAVQKYDKLYNGTSDENPFVILKCPWCGAQMGVVNRHGIILAKNYEAKKFGVQTGEALWQAKEKCKDLVIVPPHYEQYLKYSKLAREIYADYTDKIEPYGMDECWLDVTGSVWKYGSGENLANVIRERMKFELGLTVSVGVSFNKIFAKLGSDIAETAFDLFNRSYRWNYPIRSVTVRAINLHSAGEPEQIDLFGNVTRIDRQEKLETVIEEIRGRFGKYSIMPAALCGHNEKLPTDREIELKMPTGMVS